MCIRDRSGGVPVRTLTARSVRSRPRTSASPWCRRSGPALSMCFVGGSMAAMVNGSTPFVDAEVTPEGHRRATAQVAEADFRLGTSSSPPSMRAAASATEPVPTASRGAVEGWGTVTPASSPAVYDRRGTPRRAAAPVIPGSSALVSSVTSSTTSPAAHPASSSVLRISPSTSSAGAPRRAPTPTTSSARVMGDGPFGQGAGGAGKAALRCGKPGQSASKGAWRYSSRSARS